MFFHSSLVFESKVLLHLEQGTVGHFCQVSSSLNYKHYSKELGRDKHPSLQEEQESLAIKKVLRW